MHSADNREMVGSSPTCSIRHMQQLYFLVCFTGSNPVLRSKQIAKWIRHLNFNQAVYTFYVSRIWVGSLIGKASLLQSERWSSNLPVSTNNQ